MEFLITILLMLVPLIFKGIEKVLTKATPPQTDSLDMEDEVDVGQAQDEELETIRKTLREAFPEIGLPSEVDSSDDKEDDIPVKKVSVEYVPVNKLIEIQPVKQNEPSVVEKNGVVDEIRCNDIQTSEKKEKIDAKKLIIYSEIMKPKY